MHTKQESSQWCVRLIQAEQLCARTNGSAAIPIAMIDGAVDGTHPDFSASPIRQILGGNRSTCQNLASEACQHGTFVAGILSGRRGSPAPSLAPECPLLSLSLFCEAESVDDCPRVRPAEVARAIRSAIRNGARVVNLSLGLLNPHKPELAELFEVYDVARQKGVLIVAAGGNQSQFGVNPLFEHNWVLPVAACDRYAQLAPNSNAGGRLVRHGLLAPGLDVYSTAPGGAYTWMSGTSVAAPFVSGILALLWSLFPNASAEALYTALRPRHSHPSGSTPPLLDAERSFRSLDAQFSVSRKDSRFMVPSELLEEGPENASLARIALDSSADGDLSAIAALAAPTLGLQSVRPQANSAPRNNAISTQSCACSDKGFKGFVYVVGRIRPVFPSAGLRNEYLYAFKSLPPREHPTEYDVFSNPAYRYITELMCWVLEIDNVDTYIVKPRSALELNDIVESLKPPVPGGSSADILTAIVGTLGPVSSPESCGGLLLPQATANQVFHFTVQDLVSKLKGNSINEQAVRDLLDQMILRPNNGATPGERAINFMALRYPEVFKKHAMMITPPHPQHDNTYFLVNVRTRPSAAGGNRVIEDVIFQYQKYSTSEQEFFYTSIDVSGQFPFVNTPMRPFMPEL